MKIRDIIITIEPNQREIELGRGTLTLMRNSDKIWKVISVEKIEQTVDNDELDQPMHHHININKERGLLPYELKLAMMLQTEIVEKFNFD